MIDYYQDFQGRFLHYDKYTLTEVYRCRTYYQKYRRKQRLWNI